MPRRDTNRPAVSVDDSHNASFVPETPTDWPDPDPQTVGEALDDIMGDAYFAGHSHTFGSGKVGQDVTLTFVGETNTGVFKWMEDEEYFLSFDHVMVGGTRRLYFYDTDIYIYCRVDGVMAIDADTTVEIGHGGNIELGDGDLHNMTPQTTLKVNAGTSSLCFNDVWSQQLYGLERSSDPTEPAEGQYVIWMSDGTGKGDDGDVMIASQAGGVTKYGTLFDHSGGAAW